MVGDLCANAVECIMYFATPMELDKTKAGPEWTRKDRCGRSGTICNPSSDHGKGQVRDPRGRDLEGRGIVDSRKGWRKSINPCLVLPTMSMSRP